MTAARESWPNLPIGGVPVSATGTTIKRRDAWAARVHEGRKARDEVPLEVHAEVDAADSRPDPVAIQINLLEKNLKVNEKLNLALTLIE